MAEKKRRGHNEGSVYYEEGRDRWVAAVSIGPGKRKKFYFKTKQEALKKKNEALRELEQGTLATGSQRKLKDYLEDWIENVHKDKLRISTYVKYKKLIKYIVADLGDIWLQKLTPEQVRRFYTKMGTKKDKGGRGLSSKTIHEIHGVLHLALDNAVRWNYVGRNVCDLVKPPRIVSREATPLTLEQAQVLLNKVREHRLEVLLTMAVVTGMRRGELLALRWANIDFERQTLLVLHTVDYIPHYGYVETEPKTKAGRRLISLPSFLLDMLQQHRVKLLKQQLKQGDDWENRDLVFPDLRGGYFNSNYLLRIFKKLLKEAGLPHMHFHDLRHSAATILLSMGVNMKVIQELLGHSDVAITLGLYSHLLSSMQKDVMSKWDDVFGSDDKDKDLG
jgi:integrase